MKLKIAQVIGLNTDQKAAQVTSATRDDHTLLAVLEIACDDAFTRGRQALSSLEDFYFEFEGEAAGKLTATFTEAENKFFQGTDFDLTLAAISGKVLYFIRKGDIAVYLKRGGQLSPLSVSAQSQLISGFLQDSDKLLFATGSLVAFLNEELEKSLDLPVEVFKEEVESKIGASELENQGLAALTVEVTEGNVDIAPFLSENGNQAGQVNRQADEGSVSQASIMLKSVIFKTRNLFRLFRQLGSYLPGSGRGRLLVAVILIVVIAAGAGYKYKLSRDAGVQSEFNALLQEAKDSFNAAKGLASLNPADAKSKLDLSKGKVNQALLVKPQNAEAETFKKQIDQESSSILQQSNVSDFPLFLDLDLVKKEFRAVQMSLSKDKLLLMDPSTRTLVAVDIVKKSNQILAGSEKLGEAAFVSLNGGLAFIYSEDKGVLRIDTTSSKLSTVSKKDEELGSIKDIYGFAGNIYLLDQGKNMIWKYLPAADSYSGKREYLSKDTKADFSGSLRMQIESSIYVLKNGGEILRFTKGDKDNFSYSGLPAGVKDPKSMFTSSDTDNLYVLDSGNSRLLVLTKTGGYKGQITGDKFATATDLAVDEVGKKVYLLEGSKIYSVDLK